MGEEVVACNMEVSVAQHRSVKQMSGQAASCWSPVLQVGSAHFNRSSHRLCNTALKECSYVITPRNGNLQKQLHRQGRRNLPPEMQHCLSMHLSVSLEVESGSPRAGSSAPSVSVSGSRRDSAPLTSRPCCHWVGRWKGGWRGFAEAMLVNGMEDPFLI